jgi:REP element-mobilizing transposase RayT
MSVKIPLEFGKYYHIYNRGNNSETVFNSDKEFKHFLELYEKYITPVADTFAWALMSNHFHFFVRIKMEVEIGFLAPLPIGEDKEKWKIISKEEVKKLGILKNKIKQPNPSRQFSHLFNAYAKYYNVIHQRTGSLFEKSFERTLVDSERYKKHMVYYIHHNPIHHGIVQGYTDYKWTSYNDFVDKKDSFVVKDEVLDWFFDIDNFIFFHQQEHDLYLSRGDEED